jgi:hypothetical protein
MFDVLPYQFVLLTHIGAFVWSVIGIVTADSQGARWLLGWRTTLNARSLHFWHRWVWVGIAVSVLSGFYMFWPVREYLLTQPTFLLKVSLVLVLCLNALFIGKHMQLATQQAFAGLTPATKRALCISGGVSTLCWISVATLGVLLPL